MNSSSSIEILSAFVDTAERNRNYPSNTAAGLRSALRLFERELNGTERASVEQLSKNLDKIYRQVVSRNQQKMTAASMETYRRRIKNLLSDYENYGVDPTRIAEWNRPTRKVLAREPGSVISNPSTDSSAAPTSVPNNETPATSRLEIVLRPDARAILVLPANLTKEDAAAIKALVDASVRSAHL
ncbi:MAG: Uncharacterized protein G01um101438_597 [Parcubacteria group bacterium Gr01-1014_38]|nr:MAG: Uncharacterized protein G01um101438_597 [Parcubacteria group bacterium Gr01-1014_38]